LKALAANSKAVETNKRPTAEENRQKKKTAERPSAAQPWREAPDPGAKRRRAEQTCERRSIAAAELGEA